MFQPTQHDVRRFFCSTWSKLRRGQPLDLMQALAARWIDLHPEYHADLGDEAAALAAVYGVDGGRENPFLHLGMHLTIDEQVSIDQPSGIRDAVQRLAQRLGSMHAAQHAVMECLGAMIWTSQRSGAPPDGQAYVEAVRRLAAG